MLAAMRNAILLLSVVVTFFGCKFGSSDAAFFSGDISTRNARLAALPLERQWELFKYGNQVQHPPATGLAEPIAPHGRSAVVFILDDLDRNGRDLDFRDSLVVFQAIQRHGYFDICSDHAFMDRIRANEARIKSDQWRSVYAELRVQLCLRPPGRAQRDSGERGDSTTRSTA